MKYRNFIIIGLLVFSFGCQKAAMKEQTAAKPVKVKEVETFTPNKGSRYSASIRPNTQVEVGFKVGGYVDSIANATDVNGFRRTIQAGDIVSKGQFLAQLRRSDYQTKVDQAKSQKSEIQKSGNTTRAQLNETETAIFVNQSQVREAEVNLERAKLDFTRAENLYNVQALTKKDYDAAKTNLDTAQARLDSAKGSLNSTKAKTNTVKSQIEVNQSQVETAQTVIDQMQIPLQDTTLRAPFSATILERRIETGALATPNTPVFILADTTSVKAVFGVPDVELQTLKNGQVLALTTEALPNQEFSGRVSRIAPSADQNSRVFEVEVTIPNLQNLLKPGMIASLELMSERTNEASNVVLLSAIVRSKDKADSYAVFVVQEIDGAQVARSREVVLGETFGNTVAITKGLDKGEKVVISGATLLADGEKIQIIP